MMSPARSRSRAVSNNGTTRWGVMPGRILQKLDGKNI